MAGRRRSILALGLLVSGFLLIYTAGASETITYSYDARGRLVKVVRSGTVNNGVSACYSYDKADNRSNVTVATSSDCGTPPPSFAINDISVTEGGNLVFTVTRTGSTSSSFSVDFGTANGTASGADYTANSGTLTFAAADTSKTITVATIDDATVESAETVLVNLSAPTGGATIADAQGIGTINDNDVASPPSFSIGDASAVEGNQLIFTVTKTGAALSNYSVNFATANGTAMAGYDYTANSGTLTFAPADTSKTVYVNTAANNPIENIEKMYVNLSGATGGATIGDAQGVGSITDQCSDIGAAMTSGSPGGSTQMTQLSPVC